MKNIDFTKYPKILPYVEHLNGKSFFNAKEYNPMTEETFIDIVHGWINKFEQDIDKLVENTYAIYKLTVGETGYNALSHDWKKRKGIIKEPIILDKEFIRNSWTEKLSTCISHFYQSFGTDKKYKGGVTGCFITCSFNVELLDSEYKHVINNAVSDFTMYLKIGTSLHKEYDMIEY